MPLIATAQTRANACKLQDRHRRITTMDTGSRGCNGSTTSALCTLICILGEMKVNAGGGSNVMGSQIIDLHTWFQTPAGRYLLDWEARHVNAAVADVFGYHALQLGLPSLDALAANRMPHQWLAMEDAGIADASPLRAVALQTHFAALPFPASSIDLVVLPHTLELTQDPHATLREVARVLVPEGRVVITGLNPVSLWAWRQRRAHLYRRFTDAELFLPDAGEFIGYWRLRDWMRLLGLDVESGHFGCYRAATNSEKWLTRLRWMDRLGERWWPIFGAAYFMVAVKRVKGMRLLGPAWKPQTVRAGQSVPAIRRDTQIYDRESQR